MAKPWNKETAAGTLAPPPPPADVAKPDLANIRLRCLEVLARVGFPAEGMAKKAAELEEYVLHGAHGCRSDER